MSITQGAFSFLPDLTDDQIRAQVQYCIDNEWAVSLEFTDDPHPRNTYWDMWGHPMFDNPDAAALLLELKGCRRAYGARFIRFVGVEALPRVARRCCIVFDDANWRAQTQLS